jgi:Dolichyl-phosphate-mannose-protein mannosyltransferase
MSPRSLSADDPSHRGGARVSSSIAFILLIAHAVLAWLARTPGILTTSDDATYILLARSLRDFQYREIFRIDEPFHRMYPPGYPFLLALWSGIGGERFDWLVILSIASSVGTLAFLFSTIRRLWGPRYALASLVALAVNPWLVEAAGAIASEAPFMFFQVLTLWTFSRDSNRPSMSALAGAAAIAAAMVRSIGATLIIAVGLCWLWRRRFTALTIYTVSVILTVGLWLGWASLNPEQAPGGGSYVADATAGMSEFGLWSIVVARTTSKFIYPLYLYRMLPGADIPGTPVDGALGVLFVSSALIAALPVMLTSWPAAFLYLMAYGALLWIWPWPADRFLIPVLVLAVPLAIIGASRLVGWLRPGWAGTAAMVVAVVVALNGARTVAGVIERRGDCVPGAALPFRACLSDDQASFFSAVQYVRKSAPPDAVFLTGKRATLYYYTGRRAVSQTMALSQSPSDFLPFLRHHGVTHVLLLAVMPFSDGTPSASQPALGEMLKANCEDLHLEASFPPGSFLFRVPSVGETPDRVAACGAVDVYLERERAGAHDR